MQSCGTHAKRKLWKLCQSLIDQQECLQEKIDLKATMINMSKRKEFLTLVVHFKFYYLIVFTISWYFLFYFLFTQNFENGNFWEVTTITEKKSDICSKLGRNSLLCSRWCDFLIFQLWVLKFYLLHQFWTLLMVKWFKWVQMAR